MKRIILNLRKVQQGVLLQFIAAAWLVPTTSRRLHWFYIESSECPQAGTGNDNPADLVDADDLHAGFSANLCTALTRRDSMRRRYD